MPAFKPLFGLHHTVQNPLDHETHETHKCFDSIETHSFRSACTCVLQGLTTALCACVCVCRWRAPTANRVCGLLCSRLCGHSCCSLGSSAVAHCRCALHLLWSSGRWQHTLHCCLQVSPLSSLQLLSSGSCSLCDTL